MISLILSIFCYPRYTHIPVYNIPLWVNYQNGKSENKNITRKVEFRNVKNITLNEKQLYIRIMCGVIAAEVIKLVKASSKQKRNTGKYLNNLTSNTKSSDNKSYCRLPKKKRKLKNFKEGRPISLRKISCMCRSII